MEHLTTAFTKRTAGVLALEDGHCFHGISVGYEGCSTGEVLFHTGMTGYQGVFTDPSYAGHIAAMTYPQIGNVGINPEDNESDITPPLCGVLMRELSTKVSNWRATENLSDFFQRHEIVALSEIDTRSITQHLRTHGSQRAVIASGDWNTDELIQKAKNAPRIEETDFIEHFTVSVPMEWSLSDMEVQPIYSKKIAVFDFGVKRSILRSLASLGAKVIRIPARTSADDVLKMQPDGVVLSNGPGDPARLGNVVNEVAKLIGKVPIFGIGLGHQILGKALGAATHRLSFGHWGTQPVKNRLSGRVEMTPQNHNFCIVPVSLPPEVEVTHVNLHDGTVEGFRHKELPMMSVQFQPAGQHETAYLFEQFLRFDGN